MGVIIHQLHTTHTEGVVDVGDILADVVVSLLQLPDAVLLAMVGVHHLGDIMARHIDALELALFVADGVDSGFVIHLTLQTEIIQSVFRQIEIAKNDDTTRQRIGHLTEWYLTEEGVVLQEETAIEHLFASLDAKGSTGSFVDIGEHAVLIVVQHIEQRGIEDGVITHQQLIDLLLATILISNIVLNSHQRGGQAVGASAHHREGYLIMSAVGFVFRPTTCVHLSRINLTFADGEDLITHFIHVVAMEELGEIGRYVFTLIFAFLGQVAEMTCGRVVKPKAQITGLHDQR